MKKYLILIVLASLSAACRSTEPQGIQDARIISIEVSPAPTGLSAVFVATTNFNPSTAGTLGVGIDIWEDGDSYPRRVWGGKNDTGFITKVEGLIPDYSYNFRGFLQTDHGEIFSPQQTFTTGSDTQADIPDFDWSVDEGLTAQSIISFSDADLGNRLTRAFDKNGDGALSVGEAALVRSFKGVLGPKENFTSFDEFRFFTGIASLGYEDRDNDYIVEYYDSGFQEWLRLTSIVLPPGLKEIGHGAFLLCSSLRRVTIPEGVEVIKGSAFSNCTRLMTINLPQSLRSIGVDSFWRCNSLQSINIPEGVEELPFTAFKECTALRDITLPRSLKTIGLECFANCTSLRHIELPQGLREIEGYAFFASGLEEIVIPEGFTSIPYALCKECRNLTAVKLPSGIMEIQGGAFSQCVSLKEISLPDGLISIGPLCFGESGLTEIEIPASVLSMDGAAFAKCAHLGEMRCLPTDPPSLFIDIFESTIPAIYVPAASLNAYRNADVWSGYADKIQAIK